MVMVMANIPAWRKQLIPCVVVSSVLSGQCTLINYTIPFTRGNKDGCFPLAISTSGLERDK